MAKSNVVIRKALDELEPGYVSEPGLDTGTESWVQHQDADACDINKIFDKHAKDHTLIEHVNRYQGYYGDVADVVDYATALRIVEEADDAFMSLPADIRKRFGNDPSEFLSFVDNPDNLDEMQRMGLVPPESVPVQAAQGGAQPTPEG